MKWLLVTTAVISTSATADETLKWRHVQHAAAFKSQEVGDVKGHIMSVYRLPGLAMFPDGSMGTSTVIGESDVINGSGTIEGYNSVTVPDGSTLWMKYTGTINSEGKKAPRKGTYVVIGGTGKYQGAKGEGTWEGDGTAVGPDVISYIDNVINIGK